MTKTRTTPIQTRKMAEAVRPRPRKQKVNSKKKDQQQREPSPLRSLTPSPVPQFDNVLGETDEIISPKDIEKNTDDSTENQRFSQKQAVIRPNALPNLISNDSAVHLPQQNVNQLQTEEIITASDLEKITQNKQVTPENPSFGSKHGSKANSPGENAYLCRLAVVEDPDTPMSRASSPAVSRQTSPEEIKPPVTLEVLEEKSPSDMAQEALARMQIMASTLAHQQTPQVSNTTLSPTSVDDGRQTHVEKNEEDKAKGSSVKLGGEQTLQSNPLVTQGQKQANQRQMEKSLERAVTTNPSPVVRPQPLISAGEEEKPKKRIGAMSLNELKSLYLNPQLAFNEKFIDEFVQREVKKENHEFAEILSNFLRARHQLASIEEEIHSLQKNYTSLQQDLWITHTKSILVQGQCADQVQVNASHTYEQCELNAAAVSNMSGVLKNIRTNIAENLSLYSYSAQISKLQVESYIHDLYVNHPVLCNIPKNAGVLAGNQLTANEQYQVNKLKECITILFYFHRKPTKDEIFIESIRTWTVRLVSTLLRIASFSDHMYILNHLLRCPAGVSNWATQLLQVPVVPLAVSGPFEPGLLSDILNHIVTSLATILLPIKAREEFMTQMRVSFSPESIQEDRAWIMVDSDGEEDEDPVSAWLFLHENDIVAILGQFPLSEVFSRILFASISESGQVDYDIRRSTEPSMMKLFAFSTVLCQLLGTGLRTYSMARYRQLNKRLGRLIRQTVSFVSDHWLNFKTYFGPMVSITSMETLQAEFDQLFMRATYSILSAQKLGSWQFMAEMPFTSVSQEAMWQLLWVLHQGQDQVVNLDSLPQVNDCRQYLQDPDTWQQLSDNLMHTTTSEAIYLLTTFSNMASCRNYIEQDFIHLITQEVFEVAYICNHTREFCSKVGRDLLSSVIQTHPSALSFLLARVKEVITKLGKMALYLFTDLPVSIWQPTDPDMLILRQWLLNFDLLSPENKLARIILFKLNWDVFEQTGRPVIDIKLHRQMALLLVEAYSKFIVDKKAGFFILEGMKQMASFVTASVSAEQQLNNWVWDLATKLKLHQQSVSWYATSGRDDSFRAPDIGAEKWLLPLLRGVTNKIPVACFIALTMTNIGHDTSAFLTEGLQLLEVLTANYQYTTAIYVLGCVVPLFIHEPQLLLGNESFTKILESIVVADESLIKSTKSTIMSVEFPGLVTEQLTEMIQTQISSHLAIGTADMFISFWMNAIFKVCKYFSDRNCCYVMDSLIQWTFVKKGVKEMTAAIIRENYMCFAEAVKHRQGIVSSMLSWIAANSLMPSFLDSPWLSQFPWLAYMIITLESDMQVASGLWQEIQRELHSPRPPNVENAMKSAVSRLKLDRYPTLAKLSIYRWSQQALETPMDHPLLPVIWQHFFGLFLGRQLYDSSITQRASNGERFFESMTNSSVLKKMRNRLQETSRFHMNFDPQAERRPKRTQFPNSPLGSPIDSFDVASGSNLATEEATAPNPMEEETMEYSSSKEFHHMLASMYQTFSLWLEEPRLHDGNLYLPSLPPQYEAVRLNQVFQGFMNDWLEFVDLEGIQYKLSCLAASWRNRMSIVRPSSPTIGERLNMSEPENATQRILRRLRRYDHPKKPPPIMDVESAIPLINSAIIEDHSAFMHLISSDLDLLKHHTVIFSSRLAHHCALDNQYVELVPSHFSNNLKSIQLTAACRSSINPMHRCRGPAVIMKNIEIKERNEITHHKIEENRVEYKQLMIEQCLPTPLNICVAAVHTENAITRLIKLFQKATGSPRSVKLSDTACSLYYYLAGMVSEETNVFPPTKQFLGSCIEILGQEFVSREPSQVDKVLQLCLDKPSVSGLVSPHFIPNLCPTHFVRMYSQLLHILQAQNMDLVFALLTKFDLPEWLESHNPSEGDRKLIIEALGSSLKACGVSPAKESQLVFGLYLVHLKLVLHSNFPSNLFMVLNMVFQGSASVDIDDSVWKTLLSVTFTGNISEEFDRAKIERCNDVQLSTVQICELIEWISTYFMQIRMTDPKAISFGLYMRWSRYTPYISLMFSALIHSYANKTINSSDMFSPFQMVEILWKPLAGLFSPWIQIICGGPNYTMNPPWVEAEDQAASHLVAAFVGCIDYIYQLMNAKYPDNANGILSLLLMYYMTSLCTKVTQSHAIDVFVGHMKMLPWEQLRPDLALLEIMTKVKEVSSPCCFTLIGHILPAINWKEVIGFHVSQTPPEVASRFKTALGVLLIQAFVDEEWSRNEKIQRLLSEAETFDWLLISQEGFSCICSWFLQHRDPRCVLAQRSSPMATGSRILKQMSGFQTNAVWHSVVSSKRLTYIHCLTQLLCQLTYLKDVEKDNVKTAIVNLLSEIEAMEMSVPSVEDQQEESMGMLKQVLGLLNNSNPNGDWLDLLLSSITGWFHSSPQTLLLEPCIKSATGSLASLQHMATILETCMEVYFIGLKESLAAPTAHEGWDFMLSIYRIPELNQAGYVNDALSVNAYLVLYAYLRHKVPFCSSVNDEFGFMEEILSICTNSHLSEEDEDKAILWWHLLLDMAVKNALNNPSGVINVITRFNAHLSTIGQQRNQKGFLGAIGLGRKSPLSKKMRILALTLMTFLQAQINVITIRMQPGSTHKMPSLPSSLNNIEKAKLDSSLLTRFNESLAAIRDPARTLPDVFHFLTHLALGFFPNSTYLLHGLKCRWIQNS